MVPHEFWLPWSELDPDGANGGIVGALDDFVAPSLGDNPRTKNIDIVAIFNAVRDSAAALSMHPFANMEGPPTRNVIEETLRALNWCMERIMDRTKTTSSGFFNWTHATPPYEAFAIRPIRFPLRSTYMNEVIYFMLGTQTELAEVNANALHSGLDPSSSHRLLSPLFHLKSNIVKDWFDQEVEGEITMTELNEIFSGIARPGPNIVPAGESQTAPAATAVEGVMSGVDLIQWYPAEEHWAIFAKKQAEVYKAERIFQPEGAVSTTEDVAPEKLRRATTPVTTPG